MGSFTSASHLHDRIKQAQRGIGCMDEPQMGPLIFKYDGDRWYDVYANDRGERGEHYGSVRHDGGKFESAPDASYMSFKELQALYWWMERRQEKARGKP